MNTAVFFIFATVVVCLYQSVECHKGKDHHHEEKSPCLKNFFECVANKTSPEQRRTMNTMCCEDLLTNSTFNFLMTLLNCVYVKDISAIVSCLYESGEHCGRILPKIFLKDSAEFVEFHTNVIVNSQPPSDSEDCSNYALDFEDAFYNQCQNNTREDVKLLCDAFIKRSS